MIIAMSLLNYYSDNDDTYIEEIEHVVLEIPRVQYLTRVTIESALTYIRQGRVGNSAHIGGHPN